ncbi:hypothetical protein EW026_g7549 [Hermanssonia centrifuga]|uniref:Protein-S-isoprenylcysteine O-methyltransferase n=1 Tax=Hermanssonia centrifuga TaxID=98765 RepID=A0A4S4K7F9_9APHY|nr:hypothetical protein EW026_g7549 [Hermanssonia centrifuga]
MAMLWKIPLILIVSASLEIAMTAPNPNGKAQSEERQRYDRDNKTRDAVPMPLGWGPPTFKGAGHVVSLLEIAAILVSLCPSALRAVHLDWIADSPFLQQGSKVAITSPFIFGFLLSVFGAYIRLTCYRYLGRQFTFSLTLQKDHKLITGGPYAIVRHPSYTGLFAFYFGSLVSQMGPGSFWFEAGLWNLAPAKGVGVVAWGVMWAIGVFYVAYRLWVGYALFERVNREDTVLMDEFKDQWVTWSKNTPYRLIPYVY